MMRVRRIALSVAVLAASVSLFACGGGGSNPVVVRVGGSAITTATVEHWMKAMAPEHVVPDPPRYSDCISRQEALSPQSITAVLKEECQQQYQALKQRAIAFLISSQWLIGEAAEQGAKASAREQGERRTEMSSIGSSDSADAKIAIDAPLAQARIRRALIAGEPAISQAQTAAFYRRNISRFERRERRYIYIVEHLPSQAAARRVLRKFIDGTALSKIDVPKVAIDEAFDKPRKGEVLPRKKAILRTVFAVKPHVLVGPLPLNHTWCFFEVKRVRPAVVKPLARVQGEIERQLEGEQRRRTLARFIVAWRAKWIARTDCSPGYVVQKCRQYRGARAREDPVAFS